MSWKVSVQWFKQKPSVRGTSLSVGKSSPPVHLTLPPLKTYVFSLRVLWSRSRRTTLLLHEIPMSPVCAEFMFCGSLDGSLLPGISPLMYFSF